MREAKKDTTLTERIVPTEAVERERESARAKETRRTTGNKLFDILVYPSIAFGAVFAFSVWMLHTTKFGTGKWRNKYEGWVDSTAKWMKNSSFFKGQSEEVLHKKAGNYITAAVSFAVGTVLIAPIKLFEDRRSQISHKIDRMLGSVPQDESAYEQEPKQSWSSVLGGRVITFGAIVALVATLGHQIDKGLESIAKKVSGTWHKWNPSASETQLKTVKEWSYVSVFEGFYSAACAAMIYVASRSLARFLNKKEKINPAVLPATEETPVTSAPDDTREPEHAKKVAKSNGYVEAQAQRKVAADSAIQLSV